MSRNTHDRQLDHHGAELDTDVLLDGATTSYADQTPLHTAVSGLDTRVSALEGTGTFTTSKLKVTSTDNVPPSAVDIDGGISMDGTLYAAGVELTGGLRTGSDVICDGDLWIGDGNLATSAVLSTANGDLGIHDNTIIKYGKNLELETIDSKIILVDGFGWQTNLYAEQYGSGPSYFYRLKTDAPFECLSLRINGDSARSRQLIGPFIYKEVPQSLSSTSMALAGFVNNVTSGDASAGTSHTHLVDEDEGMTQTAYSRFVAYDDGVIDGIVYKMTGSISAGTITISAYAGSSTDIVVLGNGDPTSGKVEASSPIALVGGTTTVGVNIASNGSLDPETLGISVWLAIGWNF